MNRFLFLLTGIFTGLLIWSSEASAETLEEALGSALLSHPQAKVALSRLKAEQETIGAVAANFWPILDIAAGIGVQNKNVPDGINDRIDEKTFTRQEGSFSVRQNIFLVLIPRIVLKVLKKR